MPRTEVTGKQIKDSSVDLTVDVTGILPVANGGTGSNTVALNNVILGNGTGAVQTVAPGTSGNVLTSNGTTWASTAPAVTLTNSVTLSGKTLTSPKIQDIRDQYGNVVLALGAPNNAVNYLQINNNTAGSGVALYALGSDTNINTFLIPKGTGKTINTGTLSVNNTAATLNSGSGTPEGSVTAAIGSLYMRTDGGAGTSLYVKESGSGNTGWVAK